MFLLDYSSISWFSLVTIYVISIFFQNFIILFFLQKQTKKGAAFMSIHKVKNLSTEIHILVTILKAWIQIMTYASFWSDYIQVNTSKLLEFTSHLNYEAQTDNKVAIVFITTLLKFITNLQFVNNRIAEAPLLLQKTDSAVKMDS